MKPVNLLFVFAIIAVCIAFLNVIITLNKVKTITGFATGTANLSVESLVSINFSENVIDFGSGLVDIGALNATLQSDSGSTSNGNWSFSADNLTLENIGNINCTIALQAGAAASSFIGGLAAGGPNYKWNISDIETSSCAQNGTPLGNYTEVNSSQSSEVCSPLKFVDSNDTMRIDIRLVVPYDSKKGALGDTITATGTAA